MFQKQKGLDANRENPSKIYVIENKIIVMSSLTSVRESGKNAGKFHYVIENKCRKIVRFVALHDVIENTRLIYVSPLC